MCIVVQLIVHGNQMTASKFMFSCVAKDAVNKMHSMLETVLELLLVCLLRIGKPI